MNELKKEPALHEENVATQNPVTKEEFFEFFKQVIDFAKKPSKSQEKINPKEKPTKFPGISLDEIVKPTAYSAVLASLISYWEEHKEDLNLDEDRLNDLYDSFDPSFDDLIEVIKSSVYADKNKFSKQLKESRTAKGLTQKALARQTKIPLRTIEAWEAEERTPPEYVQRLLLNELKKDNE